MSPACTSKRNLVHLAGIITLGCCMVLTGCSSNPERIAPVTTTRTQVAHMDDTASKLLFDTAIARMQDEEWQAAIELFDKIIASDTGYPGVWLNRGIAHVQTGDSESAEADFHQALTLDPQLGEAWNQLGILYRRSNRLEDARNAYLEALKFSPDNADANWNLAILLDRQLNDPQGALAYYSRYQTLTNSSDPQLQQWIAILHEQVPASENIKADARK